MEQITKALTIGNIIKTFLDNNFNDGLDEDLTPIESSNIFVGYVPEPLPYKPSIVIIPDKIGFENLGSLSNTQYQTDSTVDIYILLGQAKQPTLYNNLIKYTSHLISLLVTNQTLGDESNSTSLSFKESEYYNNYEGNESINLYRIQIEMTI